MSGLSQTNKLQTNLHPSADPTGYPKLMHHKGGLASRHVGSAQEQKALGADWREEAWPKSVVSAAPAPLRESKHELIGGKPAEVGTATAPEVPSVERLVQLGYHPQVAAQMAADMERGGGTPAK